MEIITGISTSVLEACAAAFDLQRCGQYEAAAETIEHFWPGPGAEPSLDGLSDRAAGEILLLAGTLTGQLGSSKGARNFQEFAKNLITRASERLHVAKLPKKYVEARAALAVCYWRNGSFDDAKIVLRDALQELGIDDDSRLRVMITLALVDRDAGSLTNALEIYGDCANLCKPETDPYLVGTYHMNFAIALRSANQIDRALIESMAASFHLEQCGHLRYLAQVENNTAMLLSTANRFQEAQQHATRAEKIFRDLQDSGNVAQVQDTRAQIYLAAGKFEDAERCARLAVKTLAGSDAKAVLVEALKTRGVALLKLNKRMEALEEFAEATKIADTFLSERESAGVLQVLIEELAGPTYLSSRVGLERAVGQVEARIIKEALVLSNGRITEAAFRLGMSHQALDFILEGRQKHLKAYRAPKRRTPKR